MRARRRALMTILAAATYASSAIAPLRAEDGWNPFKNRDDRPLPSKRNDAAADRSQPASPAGSAAPWSAPGSDDQYPPRPNSGYGPSSGASYETIQRMPLPPLDEASRAVESGALPPPMASDGSGLPLDIWQGLDAKAVSELVAGLDMPPRSPALGALWRRLWTTRPGGGSVAPGVGRIEAVNREVLYRSGLLGELARRDGTPGPGGASDPVIDALDVRFDILAGDRDRGCAGAKTRARSVGDLPKPVRADIILLSGYCAALEGNLPAAALASELARSEGAAESYALDVLDALGSGSAISPTAPKRLSLLDYRILELAKVRIDPGLVDVADPAALVAMATSRGGSEGRASSLLAIRAGERAARLQILDGAGLAAVYGAQNVGAAELGDPAAGRGDPALRRAALFKAIEAERTPMRKVRLVRTLLDDARRAGLAQPVAEMMARAVERLSPAQEIGWFAETAVEVNLSAGRYSAARAWVAFAQGDRGGLDHWLALIDLADPAWQGRRGESLGVVERLALRGQLSTDLMHRLVTVLDALDYQIPIPLWEAASRTPQPNGGFLPPTGVLSELQDAAKQRQFARTVLLVVRSLGPSSAEGANLVALGDSIRALRKAGLDAEARRLALEAVLDGWPRMAGN